MKHLFNYDYFKNSKFFNKKKNIFNSFTKKFIKITNKTTNKTINFIIK